MIGRLIKTDLRLWERKLIDHLRNVRKNRGKILLLEFDGGILIVRNIDSSCKIRVDKSIKL
jgi:hypothetical protein